MAKAEGDYDDQWLVSVTFTRTVDAPSADDAVTKASAGDFDPSQWDSSSWEVEPVEDGL